MRAFPAGRPIGRRPAGRWNGASDATEGWPSELKASRVKRPAGRRAAEGFSLSELAAAVEIRHGGVAEWLKASRLKRDDRKVRGFESYPLRHPRLEILD